MALAADWQRETYERYRLAFVRPVCTVADIRRALFLTRRIYVRHLILMIQG